MIGSKIKRLRERAGLSLREVAAASGVSPAGLSMIEQGQRYPNVRTLEALARVFKVRFVISSRGVVVENVR